MEIYLELRIGQQLGYLHFLDAICVDRPQENATYGSANNIYGLPITDVSSLMSLTVTIAANA